MFIDKCVNEEVLDMHHKSPIMNEIVELREKYKLSMRVEKFTEIK